MRHTNNRRGSAGDEDEGTPRRFRAAPLQLLVGGRRTTHEEDLELCRRKTPQDVHKMVESHLRLVIAITRKYAKGPHFHLAEDLYQQGVIGLMRAVEKFDPDRGFRFATYAVDWIRQSILRHIEIFGRTIRVPSWRHHKGGRQTLQPDAAPLTDDIARCCGTSGDDTEARVDQRLSRDRIERLLAPLPARLQVILRLRFGVETGVALTLSEVAAQVGVCRAMVWKLEVRALRLLRAECVEADW